MLIAFIKNTINTIIHHKNHEVVMLLIVTVMITVTMTMVTKSERDPSLTTLLDVR